MKTMTKKTLAVLIALFMLIGMLPVTALASGTETAAEVDTLDELVEAMTTGGEIPLGPTVLSDISEEIF